MDKAAVVERYKELLNQLNEPAQNVVLSAGAALVMLGLRAETANLDVDVSTGVLMWAFNDNNARLKVAGKETLQLQELGGSPRFQLTTDVTLHELDDTTGVVCVDGIWLYSPSELLKQKRWLAQLAQRDDTQRERYLAEAALIEQLIKEQRHTARVMA